jgi:uncharacterized protein (DUF924 family)
MFMRIARRASFLPIVTTFVSRTSLAAMATSASSFQLDHQLFNTTSYAQLRDLWFGSLDKNAETPGEAQVKKWFGAGSEDERVTFDNQCKEKARPALDSIGPRRLELPTFKSYEQDLEDAEVIAAPFVREVVEAKAQDEGQAAETLLSLVLLLDQMPRNIFRQVSELPLVYNHYDRLALALVQSSLRIKPDLFMHPAVARRMYWIWSTMPLTHAEHVPTHEKLLELFQETTARFPAPSDGPLAKFDEQWLKSFDEHMEPLKRFGRYPHRNHCLGRQSTPEEEAYLKTAETFGVKQDSKTAEKDEL